MNPIIDMRCSEHLELAMRKNLPLATIDSAFLCGGWEFNIETSKKAQRTRVDNDCGGK